MSTTSDRISILSRVAPELREAAKIHEIITAKLVKHRESQSELLDLARQCGAHIESAAIAIKSTGAEIALADALSAHAPNIPVKQAEKYRRLSKGLLTDPRQTSLPFEVFDTASHRQPKPAPKPWDIAWRAWNKLLVLDYARWPQDIICATRDRVSEIVERLGGKVTW